jgi:hypothetical protein
MFRGGRIPRGPCERKAEVYSTSYLLSSVGVTELWGGVRRKSNYTSSMNALTSLIEASMYKLDSHLVITLKLNLVILKPNSFKRSTLSSV